MNVEGEFAQNQLETERQAEDDSVEDESMDVDSDDQSEGDDMEDSSEDEESTVEEFEEEDMVKPCDKDDWTERNFRCEASVSLVRQLDGTEKAEQIVEFWPLCRIEPRSGIEVTWGEQYVSSLLCLSYVAKQRQKANSNGGQPELYRLAILAAKNGSDAAMEMLIRLPSMNAAFSGWLLEYEFEELLKDQQLISRRWVFKQARKTEDPGTVEEKRETLRRFVDAY